MAIINKLYFQRDSPLKKAPGIDYSTGVPHRDYKWQIWYMSFSIIFEVQHCTSVKRMNVLTKKK